MFIRSHEDSCMNSDFTVMGKLFKNELLNLRILLKSLTDYLDQPSRGGMAQVRAMTQVKPTPMMACFSLKRNVVIGLHTTM